MMNSQRQIEAVLTYVPMDDLQEPLTSYLMLESYHYQIHPNSDYNESATDLMKHLLKTSEKLLRALDQIG